MILVSACLIGVNCRYDNVNKVDGELLELFNSGKAIAVCPEILGELGVPREPCEIKFENNQLKVYSKSGKDCTTAFELGAERTLKICKAANIDLAILKANSPSCGFGKIYDGTFSGNIVNGNGLTADKLSRHGIKVQNEINWK